MPKKWKIKLLRQANNYLLYVCRGRVYCLVLTEKGKGIMQKVFAIKTETREGLYDITEAVKAVVAESRVEQGTVSVYVQGATAAIMIQENWDNSVQRDVINLLDQLIPKGVWEHDRQDSNGAAHLKAGLVGPGEVIPIVRGQIGLSTWQNIFLCEFDGPREVRNVIVTVSGC